MIKFLKNIVCMIIYSIIAIIGACITPFILPVILTIIILIYAEHKCKLHRRKNYIRKKLKPMVKEAMKFYSINITENENIIFYKNNTLVAIPIPKKKKDLDSVISLFKDKAGAIDSPAFFNNRNSCNAIKNFKEEKKIIFFSPLSTDKHFLENVHLYDLSSLDETEIKSILSMNLNDFQKISIYNKYCKDFHMDKHLYA